MTNRQLPISIVGATGLVGATLLSILEKNDFPIGDIHFLASANSIDKKIHFRGKQYLVEDLATFDFSNTRLSFFCVSNALSEEYVPKAAAASNVVIDKSHFFRNHPDVPLVVPEVNVDALMHFTKRNIIANPNCSTIPISVALKPIYDKVGIARINIATYQSVSGTGKEAVLELTDQSRRSLDSKPVTSSVYPQQIAFNVLPHIDVFEDNGYTREEMKMVWELKKIFNDDALAVNATAVRVPVFYGHSAAIHIETHEKISAKQAELLLKGAPSVKLITGAMPYPTPVSDAAGRDEVFVGRLREDISHPKGLNLWVVSDNLRKGAALNAVQIANHLVKDFLIS